MITAADDQQRHTPLMPDDLLTYKEIAKTLGVTPQTVKRRVDAGDLEAVEPVKGRPRIRRSELERYLTSLKTR